MIDYKKATEIDEYITFQWAINPLIRKFGLNKKSKMRIVVIISQKLKMQLLALYVLI